MICERCKQDFKTLFVDGFDFNNFVTRRTPTNKSYCMGCYEEVVCAENQRIEAWSVV